MKLKTKTKTKTPDKLVFILGDFITLLSLTGRIHRFLKTQNYTEDFNNNNNQLDLQDIYRTQHPTKAEYIFFTNILMEHSSR